MLNVLDAMKVEVLLNFTVTVGTVMESSHLPLTKWALAFHKMASSKKGISAKQLITRQFTLQNKRWIASFRQK